MKRAQTGFTLLELLMVVTLAGILLAIGVPTMRDFIRGARITGAANDVMVGLHMARSEAIKRRVPVTLCTSANPLAPDVLATPAPVCTASTSLTGWIIFVDTNQDGLRNANEVVLIQHEPINASITARGSANPFRVTYLNTGFALNVAASRLVLCDERGNVKSAGELSAARGITIAVTGRAGVTRNLAEIQSLITLIGGTIGGCSA